MHFISIAKKINLQKGTCEGENVICPFDGARGGTRTLTDLRPQDFKSRVYTISPPGQGTKRAIEYMTRSVVSTSPIKSSLFNDQ